jgi:hypothetical protein
MSRSVRQKREAFKSLLNILAFRLRDELVDGGMIKISLAAFL